MSAHRKAKSREGAGDFGRPRKNELGRLREGLGRHSPRPWNEAEQRAATNEGSGQRIQRIGAARRGQEIAGTEEKGAGRRRASRRAEGAKWKKLARDRGRHSGRPGSRRSRKRPRPLALETRIRRKRSGGTARTKKSRHETGNGKGRSGKLAAPRVAAAKTCALRPGDLAGPLNPACSPRRESGGDGRRGRAPPPT